MHITGAYLPGCRVNKKLFIRQSGGQCAIHPAAMQITFIHLTEVQLFMSPSCQPGSLVNKFYSLTWLPG